MHSPMAFLVLACSVFLTGCSCGSAQPSQGRTIDSTDIAPTGGYSSGDVRMDCDSARRCVLTFPDATDSASWRVEFDLEPGETRTEQTRRTL